jgi:site-specific DNA-methyltransferase (adenine-specific)
MPPEKNRLFYGDNLQVLREHLPDASVDLIYLDPPFNSRQDYNVLFAERDGSRSASQITAFKDTWEWNFEAERSYEEIVERGGRVSDAIRAFIDTSTVPSCSIFSTKLVTSHLFSSHTLPKSAWSE